MFLTDNFGYGPFRFCQSPLNHGFRMFCPSPLDPEFPGMGSFRFVIQTTPKSRTFLIWMNSSFVRIHKIPNRPGVGHFLIVRTPESRTFHSERSDAGPEFRQFLLLPGAHRPRIPSNHCTRTPTAHGPPFLRRPGSGFSTCRASNPGLFNDKYDYLHFLIITKYVDYCRIHDQSFWNNLFFFLTFRDSKKS